MGGINFNVLNGETATEEKPETKAPAAEMVIIEPANALDLDAMKTRFDRFKVAIMEMKEQADAHQVVDDDSNTAAVEMASQAKKLAKQVEALRKDIVAEPNEFVKGVNAFTKIFSQPLADIERTLKTGVTNYAREQEMKRREAEKLAREAAEKLQKKIDADAKKKGIEPVQVPTPVIPEAAAPVRTESGSAFQRKTWTFEVEDFAKVPDEFKVLDTKLVGQRVRAGIREIPGIRIFEETTTVIR